MTIISLILFLIIFILLFWKWLLLLMLAPVILIDKTRKHNAYIRESESERIPNNGNSEEKYQPSFIRKFLSGYLRYILLKIGFIPSHRVRKFFYKTLFKVSIGKNVVFHYGAEIRAPEKLTIQKGSIIGDKCLLDARNGLFIAENVNISSNVSIYTEQHDHRDPNFACNSNNSFGVQIGKRAWVGPNVIILPKVHIGEGAVIAAGAVVPAKQIGERNHDLQYEFNGFVTPFY